MGRTFFVLTNVDTQTTEMPEWTLRYWNLIIIIKTMSFSIAVAAIDASDLRISSSYTRFLQSEKALEATTCNRRLDFVAVQHTQRPAFVLPSAGNCPQWRLFGVSTNMARLDNGPKPKAWFIPRCTLRGVVMSDGNKGSERRRGRVIRCEIHWFRLDVSTEFLLHRFHLEDMSVGLELQGIVRSVKPYGAFVDVGSYSINSPHRPANRITNALQPPIESNYIRIATYCYCIVFYRRAKTRGARIHDGRPPPHIQDAPRASRGTPSPWRHRPRAESVQSSLGGMAWLLRLARPADGAGRRGQYVGNELVVTASEGEEVLVEVDQVRSRSHRRERARERVRERERERERE